MQNTFVESKNLWGARPLIHQVGKHPPARVFDAHICFLHSQSVALSADLAQSVPSVPVLGRSLRTVLHWGHHRQPSPPLPSTGFRRAPQVVSLRQYSHVCGRPRRVPTSAGCGRRGPEADEITTKHSVIGG